MKTILVLLEWETEARPQLQEAAPGFAIRYADGTPESAFTDEELSEVEIILGNPSTAALARCSGVKWVQLGSAGADAYTVPGALPAGAVLTNASGAYGLAIGEYLVAVTLELYKKLHLYRDQQRCGCWKDLGPVRSVEGSNVLVVGLGDIGGAFARRMNALGARVTGITRSPREKPDYAEAVYQMEALDGLLPQADIVSLSLPGTAETKGLFSAERIARMKEGAVLLNVGRGLAVDTQALCDALESGRLLGAALDVTDPEPLPPDHRLWQLPNAVITPHVSGGPHLRQTCERIMEICLENLRRYREGLPLENRVSLALGYRERSN